MPNHTTDAILQLQVTEAARRQAYIQALQDAIELIGMVDTIPAAQNVLEHSITALQTKQNEEN